jgi:hypothetical protein
MRAKNNKINTIFFGANGRAIRYIRSIALDRAILRDTAAIPIAVFLWVGCL